jgi:hypothetical protein
MQEGAPSPDGRRKEFLELFDAQGFGGHQRGYSGVVPRGQGVCASLHLRLLECAFVTRFPAEPLQSPRRPHGREQSVRRRKRSIEGLGRGKQFG